MSQRNPFFAFVVATVLAGGLMTGTSYGENTPVDWTVAGTIVNLQVQVFTASGPAIKNAFLIGASVKGAPGNAQFTVVGIPNAPPDYLVQCAGPGQTFFPNDMVITFADLSMLFAKSTEIGGWVCFPLQEGDPVTAVANMIVVGGTGRYERVRGGEFMGRFVSFPVGDSGALVAETGTITGWIDR